MEESLLAEQTGLEELEEVELEIKNSFTVSTSTCCASGTCS